MGCKDKHEASRKGLCVPIHGDQKELGIKCMLRKNTTAYSSAAWSWSPEQLTRGQLAPLSLAGPSQPSFPRSS
jgi:hypothetical protein